MSEQTEVTDQIDLFAILGALWRGKWLMTFCTSIALCGGVYYAYIAAVPKFSASTALVLQIRSAPLVDIEAVVSGVSTETAEINTELEVLRSRELLQKLVYKLNLTQDPEFNHALLTNVSPLDIVRSRAKSFVVSFTGNEGAESHASGLDPQEI